MNNQLIPVNFYGAGLSLIDKDGEPYAAMRPIVEGMGMNWSGQQQKLSGSRWSSTVWVTHTVGADGKTREMLCLPLRKLPGWLMSIDSSRVKPQIRNKVVQYQNECDDALWDYWNQGIAINKRAVGDDFVQGAFQEFQVTRLELVQTVGDMTEAGLRVAELMGFAGNPARFHADKLVKKQIGIGPLELLGIDALPSSVDELAYTPTALGKRFDVSGNQFNKLLEKAKLQTTAPAGHNSLRWVPTEAGKQHSKLVETSRKHSDGAPVVQLLWKESALEVLRRAAKDMALLIQPVTRG